MKLLKEKAKEKNKVNFRAKSTKRFFATISGFVNGHNTHSLQSTLKQLGLEYQMFVGAWNGGFENSFLVWNTAYTPEQFQQVILKLNELFKQKTTYIGHSVGEENGKTKYEINMWETKSLDNIHYEITKTLTSFNLVPSKMKNSVRLEELQKNVCVASSECFIGAYKREQLIKSLLKSTEILDIL